MNKDFIKKAIILPACIAFVLAIVLFVYIKINIDNFIPLLNNTQYAYHDQIAEDIEFEEDENADPSSFEKNQCIGVVRIGKGFPIRYDMDYSNIQTSVSYVTSSVPFGETGFTYLMASNVNAKEIKNAKILSIGSVFGEKKYVYKNEKSFNSEFRALNYAPASKSAVIIYYRDSNSVGFTSKYKALIYEEAE